MEVYVLISKNKSLWTKILTALFLLIGVYFLYVTFVGLIIFFAVAVPFLALAWYFYKKEMEFEYSYFDGDFRFAKIYNKQKRKELKGYEVENVIGIAPQGDRSLYSYENNPQVKTRDLTSGHKDRKVYCMVAKSEDGYEITKFEPDEKYLDAVCIKYRQKVVR